MAGILSALALGFKAARQLGPRQAGWYALYQAGLRSGLWQRLTLPASNQSFETPLRPIFPLPSAKSLAAIPGSRASESYSEADEIASGRARLFGGLAVPLELTPPAPLRHWSAYERGSAASGIEDLKFTWEGARFGWAFTLGRAYRLNGDERYPSAFWQLFEVFLRSNPPNLGPNWLSAQEVALRLIALLFAARVFSDSPESTNERLALLKGSLAAHARRIPPTLAYARAQHNNHLVSEGLGLYLAGLSLSDLPEASKWQSLGWKTLCSALRSQISTDGVYAQHSLNYHRLMLTLALLGTLGERAYPAEIQQRLALATQWLIDQVDRSTGCAPNYGSNDGALVCPLSSCDFSDYRPIAQAASRAFLGGPVFPPGPWDELSLWLGLETKLAQSTQTAASGPAVARIGDEREWAFLRAAHYTSRPAHADQLHLDLWLEGDPLALDAGTYRYSASPPWNNALARTAVHNTVTVDGLDQMRRAGKFLWLDWAQAEVFDRSLRRVSARHNGYRNLGLEHRRTVTWVNTGEWQVLDELLPLGKVWPVLPHTFRLHWLLPDWPFEIEAPTLVLTSPRGKQVTLTLSAVAPGACRLSLARAGEILYGSALADETRGWFSSTYSVKIPALSLALEVDGAAPLSFSSRWIIG